MKNRFLVVIAVTALFGLCTPIMLGSSNQGQSKGKKAEQGEAKEKHKQSVKEDHAKHEGQYEAGKNKDKDKDKRDKDRDEANDRGWERRDRFEYRVYQDRNTQPPGWSKGKKTGWGSCGVPPGQAKKGECWTYQHQGRRYYYYRDEQGRLVVRRPAALNANR